MGGGTHSYSIFHPAIPPRLQMAQRKCRSGLSRELPRPVGMKLRVIQIRLGFTPLPISFLKISINTKEEELGIKTTQGICDGFDKQAVVGSEAR